jgi:hypothetical protein
MNLLLTILLLIIAFRKIKRIAFIGSDTRLITRLKEKKYKKAGK